MVGSTEQPTTRFSDRVQDYIRFRPGYPPAMLQFFITKLGLLPQHMIADIGSGTGISSRVFLENGNPVLAVEPNSEMRTAAEKFLFDFPTFGSINGSGEATGLPSQSCDFITVAQAFHWLEPEATKREFRRVLKDRGVVALIWNDRKIGKAGFSAKYEELIRKHATDYEHVTHRRLDQTSIRAFLGPQSHMVAFPNAQELDFDGMVGRLASSSYLPSKTSLRFSAMVADFETLFQQANVRGKITIEYDTQIFYSRW